MSALLEMLDVFSGGAGRKGAPGRAPVGQGHSGSPADGKIISPPTRPQAGLHHGSVAEAFGHFPVAFAFHKADGQSHGEPAETHKLGQMVGAQPHVAEDEYPAQRADDVVEQSPEASLLSPQSEKMEHRDVQEDKGGQRAEVDQPGQAVHGGQLGHDKGEGPNNDGGQIRRFECWMHLAKQAGHQGQHFIAGHSEQHARGGGLGVHGVGDAHG